MMINVGDRVRVSADAKTDNSGVFPTSDYVKGKVGVIVDIFRDYEAGGDEYLFMPDGSRASYPVGSYYVSPAPAPEFDIGGSEISLGGVQVGDTVAVGFGHFWNTFVVSKIDVGETLYYKGNLGANIAVYIYAARDKIRLLHRPVPVEPTSVGSVVRWRWVGKPDTYGVAVRGPKRWNNSHGDYVSWSRLVDGAQAGSIEVLGDA